jgi:hypothetical protein
MAWFTVKDAVFSILIQKDECIFFQGAQNLKFHVYDSYIELSYLIQF